LCENTHKGMVIYRW